MSSPTITGLFSRPQFMSYIQKNRFRTTSPLAVLPYKMMEAPPGTSAGLLICSSNGRLVSRKLLAELNLSRSPSTSDTSA